MIALLSQKKNLIPELINDEHLNSLIMVLNNFEDAPTDFERDPEAKLAKHQSLANQLKQGLQRLLIIEKQDFEAAQESRRNYGLLHFQIGESGLFLSEMSQASNRYSEESVGLILKEFKELNESNSALGRGIFTKPFEKWLIPKTKRISTPLPGKPKKSLKNYQFSLTI